MYKCSCGKKYSRLKPFHYHRASCELLALSKETQQDVSHLTKMDVPAPLEIWMALQNALIKIEKLEKKIESQDRWIKRQKQKMSIIDWLNKNHILDQTYDTWLNSIILNRRDLQLIFDHDFVGGISYIIQRYLPVKNQEKFPIRAFEQKLNTLFIFNGKTWEMIDTDTFDKIIDEFHKKIHKVFVIWNKEQQEFMNYENVDESYYKNVMKVMGGKYSREDTLKKIKFKLFNYLKFNLKNIVQYEFTF